MTSRRTEIREEILSRTLGILQENPGLTQRDFADKPNMSLCGLNYCLNTLIDKGFVKMARFSESKS